MPQAIVSYSWAMPWQVLIDYLEINIGLGGVVWLDILACNQNAIADGDMTEILQLPRCIEFIGQTYVMPGTLSRLWCIFEMAYSLLHNRQFVYYDGSTNEDETVSTLLTLDADQLSLSSQALLDAAACFKDSDRNFIGRMLDEKFDSCADAVETIKVFVASRIGNYAAEGAQGRHKRPSTTVFTALAKALANSRAKFARGSRGGVEMRSLETPLLPD
jgi:hypothetical protein